MKMFVFISWLVSHEVYIHMYYFDQAYSNTRVPRQVHTNQHESTQINTSPTRVNTNQHESDTSQHMSDTSQHESGTSQHESTRVQHESTQFKTSQQESVRP